MRYSSSGCTSPVFPSFLKNIVVDGPLFPQAGIFDNICESDGFIIGYASAVTSPSAAAVGTWIINGPATAQYSNQNDPHSTIYGLTTPGVYDIAWSVSIAGCGAAVQSASTSIEVYNNPQITSLLTATINGGDFFNYTLTSDVASNVDYYWARQFNPSIAQSVTSGNQFINEQLTNSSSSLTNVLYLLSAVGTDFPNCQGQTYVLTATVLPNQTINFPALPTTTYGSAPFMLNATATSGLPVTFTSSNPAVATISGSTITLLSAGTTTITAFQPGNSTYAAATPVTRILTVNTNMQVAAWGYNLYGQANVPSTLSGVTAVAAGAYHSIALKNDGTVTAWGRNAEGQTNVPSTLTGVVAIAAGGYHTMALKNDGKVVAWGLNGNGQTNVPSGLAGVVAISGGAYHTVALKNDGTVAAWGRNSEGQTNVPSTLSGVVAIAAGGGFHTVALTNTGKIVAWGYNGYGQTSIPSTLTGVVGIDAGAYHTVALYYKPLLPYTYASSRIPAAEQWNEPDTVAINTGTYTLFPNPCKGRFSIETTIGEPSAIHIDIYNIMGQQVYTTSFTSSPGVSTREFDIATVPPGVYYVKINDSKNIGNHKIVVE